MKLYMTYFGIQFKVLLNNNLNFLSEELINKERIVIFIQTNKVNGNIIVGLEPSLKLDKSQYFYLSKKLKIEKFLVFEKSLFKYMKISLNEKTIIDFNYLNAWFAVKKYKQLWELLTLDSSIDEKDLIKRIHKILEIFSI
jgi:hypothetical protein